MSWVATSVIGGAVIGGLLSSNAAQNAASTEANAANNATAAQQSQFNQTQANEAPWIQSGTQALGTLNADLPALNTPFSMANFQQDPGYNFRLQQGQQAIMQSSAARGGLLGGDTLKALTNYNQDAASAQYQQAYNNYNTNNSNTFNRLASVAGLGQTSVGQTAAAGATAAGNIGNNIMSGANATAAGDISSANSINSALGTGMNTWMMSQYLNQNPAAPGTQSPNIYSMGQQQTPSPNIGY